MNEVWLRFAASLGIGLLIGLERERNPAAKAGVRTFALVALFGTLAVIVGEETQSAWIVPVGLAAVGAMLIAAYAREPAQEDPGTTTVVAAVVCYLLGALAALGDTALAGALGIGVAALLYFKPEIEGFSLALKRHEQVSVLQFLVATLIVLPILPNQTFGPYEVLNPHHIWLMVVLVSGIGLASYVALRAAGERHGVILTGILGGLISSTATTLLYARRSRESPGMERLASAVVPVANLVPLARIALIAAILAPAILPSLAIVLGFALVGGLVFTFVPLQNLDRVMAAPAPESRNPAELGTAIKFGALYALILLASAWLSDLAGSRGLYAAAAASGLADVDPIVLSALNLFGAARLEARPAITAIALAYGANLAFKFGVLLWFDRRLARRMVGPFLAMLGGGAAGWLYLATS
ncbi:MAG TPA: MgtC/SapB family protein [Burkholderiales bacterium]